MFVWGWVADTAGLGVGGRAVMDTLEHSSPGRGELDSGLAFMALEMGRDSQAPQRSTRPLAS